MMWGHRPRLGKIGLQKAKRIISKYMLTACSPHSVYIVYSWLIYEH